MKEIKFAENLRLLRQSKKISQAELGKILGVDQRTVSGWEHGVSEPSFTILAKLCDVFDETMDDLLT